MEKPLTWFILINLILLFISGCWTLGSLMIIQRIEFPLRITILIIDILANASFLSSILVSILGLAEIIKEEIAKKLQHIYLP